MIKQLKSLVEVNSVNLGHGGRGERFHCPAVTFLLSCGLCIFIESNIPLNFVLRSFLQIKYLILLFHVKSVHKIFCFGLLDKDLGWYNKVVGVGLS